MSRVEDYLAAAVTVRIRIHFPYLAWRVRNDFNQWNQNLDAPLKEVGGARSIPQLAK